MGEKKIIFTWKNYIIEVWYGIAHSVVVFFLPLYIFNSSQILEKNGLNVDMWIISLTSFTCLYTAVTGRIAIWTRWWT
jgi:Phospholipid-translocating P-type ATPase C-terminal